MIGLNRSVAQSVIKMGGTLPSDNNRLLVAFVMQVGNARLWFRVQYKFAANSKDFYVELGDFARPEKSTSRIISFSADMVQPIRTRLEDYFLNSVKEYLSFSTGQCLGVVFKPNWIFLNR